MGRPSDISMLLARAKEGDPESESRLIEVVYDELRRLAAAQLRRERENHTLQPSALVHEAYLRLFGARTPEWHNRAHFFTTAAGTMRRILVDHARARAARKRGGMLERIELNELADPAASNPETLLIVDAALEKLANWDERQARVVELHFFGGLTVDETARVLEVSAKTVKRDWSMARAWLQTQLTDQDNGR